MKAISLKFKQRENDHAHHWFPVPPSPHFPIGTSPGYALKDIFMHRKMHALFQKTTKPGWVWINVTITSERTDDAMFVLSFVRRAPTQPWGIYDVVWLKEKHPNSGSAHNRARSIEVCDTWLLENGLEIGASLWGTYDLTQPEE